MNFKRIKGSITLKLEFRFYLVCLIINVGLSLLPASFNFKISLLIMLYIIQSLAKYVSIMHNGML